MSDTMIYQIKITLAESKPPIWRRALVRGTITLYELHKIIQALMGWDNYHLHQFLIDKRYYATPAPDDWTPMLDERQYALKEVAPVEGAKFVYEYDFGDCWLHNVLVEKILPQESGVSYPRCIKGKRACPPEDVGGIWGYGVFLQAIKDPTHESHQMYVEWRGADFDSEYFSLDEINETLQETF